MKTIITTLPVYDKLAKQCFERGKHAGNDKPIPIICPRHRLPSMQWNVEADDPGEIVTVELIEQDLTSTDITSYFNTTPAYIQNGPGYGWLDIATTFDSFTSVNKDITVAVKTTAAGIDYAWNVIAAGSVITEDVAEGALAIERTEQQEIPGYARRRAQRQAAKKSEG